MKTSYPLTIYSLGISLHSKAEMETRRKAAEAQRLRQEEEDRRAALSLQAQLEKEAKDDAKYRQQLEQERRDHELALRLASESNGQVEDSPPVIRKYVSYNNTKHKKYKES